MIIDAAGRYLLIHEKSKTEIWMHPIDADEAMKRGGYRYAEPVAAPAPVEKSRGAVIVEHPVETIGDVHVRDTMPETTPARREPEKKPVKPSRGRR